MTRSRFLGLAMLVALTSTGCDTERLAQPQLSEAEADPIDALLATMTSADETARSSGGNALFDRLAGEIASFGGLYRNGHCAVAVVLTHMAEADHAIRVVKAALEPLRACPDGIRVHPVQGEFTYVELVRYHAAARELLRIDGVRGSKIDYQLNRLVVYVASRRVAHAVIEALPALGIPEKAVVFQLNSGQTPSRKITASEP
jgi:hypothetical protein